MKFDRMTAVFEMEPWSGGIGCDLAGLCDFTAIHFELGTVPLGEAV